jgi:hypothetical protein
MAMAGGRAAQGGHAAFLTNLYVSDSSESLKAVWLH